MYLLDASLSTSHLWETIVTVLFALSLIAERISNLVKLLFAQLRMRTFDCAQEKKRELRILVLAIICGIITSFAAGADLFTLLNKGNLVAIGDIGSPDLPPLRTSLGIILSGVFISLGSKFWHDMLDIVLQISALKKYKVEEKMDKANVKSAAAAVPFLDKVDTKARMIQPQLEKMPGYIGYIFDNTIAISPKILLDFSNAGPDKKEKAWLKAYFAPVPVVINTNAKISLA